MSQKKKRTRYRAIIDMKISVAYEFTATGKREAKKKAWEKFIRQLPKKLFETYIDKIDF